MALQHLLVAKFRWKALEIGHQKWIGWPQWWCLFISIYIYINIHTIYYICISFDNFWHILLLVFDWLSVLKKLNRAQTLSFDVIRFHQNSWTIQVQNEVHQRWNHLFVVPSSCRLPTLLLIPCCWVKLKPSYKTSAAVIKPLNVFGQAVLSPQSKADVDLLTYQTVVGEGEVEQLWIQEFCCTVMKRKFPCRKFSAQSGSLPTNFSQDKEHKFAHAIFSRRFLPWVWWKPCWDRHLGKRCYQATLSPTPQWLIVIQSSLVGATDLKIWSRNTRGSLSVSRTRGAPALPATKPAKKTEVSMPK